MRTGGLLLFAALAVALGGPGAVYAQVTLPGDIPPVDGEGEQGPLPNRLAGQVGIEEKLGEVVPRDLTFLDEAGREVSLRTLLDGERPLMLAFVYHSCPMLCSLVLDGVADAVATTDLELGTDYEVLAVSIDPRDTPARADSAKARYARVVEYGDPAALHFWTVGQDHEASVQALADAVGFRYAYDARTGEYAHNGVVVMLSPGGIVTRYLYGITYPARDVKLALVEASDGTVGSTLDRFLITCYQYDEDAQSYSLAVLSLLKWAGVLLLVVMGGAFLIYWMRVGGRTPEGWDDALSDPASTAH